VLAGRTFTSEEDRPGGGRLVVLGEHFWRNRLGGDTAMVGRDVMIEGEPHTVVGVMGAFDTEAIRSIFWPIGPPVGPPDVWLPLQIDPGSTAQVPDLVVAGRVESDITFDAVNAQLDLVANEFRAMFPASVPAIIRTDGTFAARPFHDHIVSDVRLSLWVLAGAVGCVLLIACANVANLLLVRATARQREMAVRAAIGAGRGHIVRQLLAECVVLATLGGTLGLALGVFGVRVLLSVNPGGIPRIGPGGAAVTLDWHVLAFTAIVSLATALVFGLLPALHASRVDLNTNIKAEGERSGSGTAWPKARVLLVMSEIGLALVLLVGAALFVRTFIALRAVEPGFDTHQVLTTRMSLTGSRFATTADAARVIQDGVDRLRALSGVQAAAAGCCVPLEGGLGLPFIIEGRPLDSPFHGVAGWTPISPEYFTALRIPVIRGRTFTQRDEVGAPRAVIINEAMRRLYWPTGDPLTERLTIGKSLAAWFDAAPAHEIVGIVGDVRRELDEEAPPTMYVPLAQFADAQTASFLRRRPLAWIVRTRGEPHALAGEIQEQLRLATGGLPVEAPRSMDDIRIQSTLRSDFHMLLLTIFGAVATLLAVLGVYALMTYSVQQRTREMGIRLALGGNARSVRNLILRQGMVITAIGVLAGLAAAVGLSRLIASLLYGVAPTDPVVLVVVPLMIAAVAFVGIWLPAVRAARISPLLAIRSE
jgi:predicted permease